MRIRLGPSLTWTDAVVDEATLLLDALRGSFGLKSVVRGCKNQSCGTCRVLVDGELVLACARSAGSVPDGARIETYEHVEATEAARDAVSAFETERVSRCKLCVAGLGVTAAYLGRMEPRARTDQAVEGVVAGAHCQCTGRGSLRRSLAFLRPKAGF